MHTRQHVPTLSHVHFESIGGVAGDMLLGALLHLGADRRALVSAYDSLGHLPHESPIALRTTEVQVADERSMGVSVSALQVHAHPASSHTQQHTGHAHHRHLKDVFELIDASEAAQEAKQNAKSTFEILCHAEAIAHNTTPEAVHLHEVGELDSVMDVLGFHVLLRSLGNPRISCTALPSGSGTVMTSHGELACPVPAVRAIADTYEIPLHTVDVQGETITPTGIALLARADFTRGPQPMDPLCSGVGAGTKRFPTVPNIVRALGWTKSV